MMSAVFNSLNDIALTQEQIEELTKYKLPSKQMAVLKRLGIRAERLRDNTVRVLRMDVLNRTPSTDEQNGPKLKSSKK